MQEIDKDNKRARDELFEKVSKQKLSLDSLEQPYLDWNEVVVGETYHLMSTQFYKRWKKFSCFPNTASMPSIIDNNELLCSQHSKFLFPVDCNSYVGPSSR